MPLSDEQRQWYFAQISKLDPNHEIVAVNETHDVLEYSAQVLTDESRHKQATPEELVHALAICMLANDKFNYPLDCLYHEKYCKHGRSPKDEVDIVIYDGDGLPYAMWELKSTFDYERGQDNQIESQLFGTAPLLGSPKLLVFATIRPVGKTPAFTLICIDRTRTPSFETWKRDGRPQAATFPAGYADPSYRPFVRGGETDLRTDCTQADFRVVAESFHNEFFGEHPDNALFINLVKCLLTKIYDERQTKAGDPYQFQVFLKAGREESAAELFDRLHDIYKDAYSRYIDPTADQPDEIDPKEFPPERVKEVVKALQGMAITGGAALHADIIGTFFEQILRIGFKQDKGMYFTHDNLVHFMIDAVDLEGLTIRTWEKATHPENRLPYVIDPSCGSGTFLLRSMHVMTEAIRSRKAQLVKDMEAEQYFDARFADGRPNGWAENFMYGLDPKFIMAITAKVNMVLHGDGSAHIFKADGLTPFTNFSDSKFRPLSDPNRTLPQQFYDYPVCESFDVVVSNPPFGITLSTDTKAALSANYSFRDSATSESLFLERWFQLLKPQGRLAVVVPESLLNAADSAESRLFLYRMFWIKAIVSLPRNLFIETPTLTSLLFAQKKSREETAAFDRAWATAQLAVDNAKNDVQTYLRRTKRRTDLAPAAIQQEFLTWLAMVVTADSVITKKGYAPVPVRLPPVVNTASAACDYYLDLIKLAGFGLLARNAIFSAVTREIDYEFSVYLVSEAGFKLSKRKERVRKNELCKFVGERSGQELPNLHLAGEQVKTVVDSKNPERILDYIRRDVKWT
jgi:type I restriction enzyme M protein